MTARALPARAVAGPETSSLVAREALACGTPVIGFPNGALPETSSMAGPGFLVGDVDEMAAAIRRAPTPRPGGLPPDRASASASSQ